MKNRTDINKLKEFELVFLSFSFNKDAANSSQKELSIESLFFFQKRKISYQTNVDAFL